MNPQQINPNAGFNLPPVAEQLPVASGAIEASIPRAEQAAVGAEQAPIVAAVAPPLATPLPQIQAAILQQNDVSVTTQSVVPSVTDDGDLIEKEWVLKAKEIVEANRDDPFKQSEELTMFKADYMQKRYNKTIKVSK